MPRKARKSSRPNLHFTEYRKEVKTINNHKKKSKTKTKERNQWYLDRERERKIER